MRLFTSHLRDGAEPVLVREGFSVWAFFFGWLWLLFRGAWVPAALAFLAAVLVAMAGARWHNLAPGLGLALLQGLFGLDLCRWSLALRGYSPGPVVAAGNSETALFRLLSERHDLARAKG